MEILRFSTHYGMHFLVPGIIAWFFFKSQWKKVWILFLATMIIDLDHLLASPIFDPGRCSIQFHPLHSYMAIAFYLALLFHPKSRILAIALLFHIITDSLDCYWILH